MTRFPGRGQLVCDRKVQGRYAPARDDVDHRGHSGPETHRGRAPVADPTQFHEATW